MALPIRRPQRGFSGHERGPGASHAHRPAGRVATIEPVPDEAYGRAMITGAWSEGPGYRRVGTVTHRHLVTPRAAGDG